MNEISELFASQGDDARQATMETLVPVFGEFRLTGWSDEAFEKQKLWPNPVWPWPTIRKNHMVHSDRFELALWIGDQLVGLGICITNDNALIINFIEGDGDEACPLKGKRAFIFADAATNYAQLRGRREVWVQPATSNLINLYVKGCGFSPPDPSTGSPYYWKRV